METCSYYKNKLHCTGLTKLERKVVSIINDNDYPKGYMKDVMQGGCVNGSVNELIYYTDTVAWYKKYRDEIDQMVQELMDETGEHDLEILLSGWDAEDPFCRDTTNQTLLAWYSFESVCYAIANILGW